MLKNAKTPKGDARSRRVDDAGVPLWGHGCSLADVDTRQVLDVIVVEHRGRLAGDRVQPVEDIHERGRDRRCGDGPKEAAGGLQAGLVRAEGEERGDEHRRDGHDRMLRHGLPELVLEVVADREDRQPETSEADDDEKSAPEEDVVHGVDTLR